uniref:Uncharacterized protein n=1 Tax=Caenorhabditis japonica TaxID=281687 RepID=A0A8R1HPR9_CAEJA
MCVDFNNVTILSPIYLLLFTISILITNCARKPHTTKPKQSILDDKTIDPNYDETQQTVELQEDPLANVRLLTPTLPGGCNDENAAKEAANRHKTNSYFPELEIQKLRIVDSTKGEELKRLVDRLSPHPPQMYRKELKEPSVEERLAQWKDFHVHWHDKGLVYLVRSNDACRAKDEGPGDTVDSPGSDEQEESKIPSEMPLSENANERKEKKAASRKREKVGSAKTQTQTQAPTQTQTQTQTQTHTPSKRSQKEKKLDRTQVETLADALKTPQMPDDQQASEHAA